MKKLLLCFFTVLFCMSLMGCIDVVQHITRKSDGTDQNTVCITASKIALEAAARMSNEHINYDELFEEYKFSETDLTEYKQFSAKFTKINDAVNMGFLIDMNIDYKDKDVLKTINIGDIDFIPKYGKNMMSIYLGSLHDNSILDDEMNLFLAGNKYRLLISKSCMPTVGRVFVKMAHHSMEMTYLDLCDEYLIEIPISFLFQDAVTIELYR